MEGRGPAHPPAPAPATDAQRLRALAAQLDDLLPFTGRALVVLASLGLIVSLFLPWYQLPVAFTRGAELPDGQPTGWESFRYSDVYLTVVAATGLAATLVAAVVRFRAPFAVSGLAGWVGVAIVLYSVDRAAVLPVTTYRPPTDLGFFLAIASSGLITGGSLLALMARRA